MGVHVHIAVVVERVSEEAWQRIYELARQVARRWTPPPLSATWRNIGNVRVAQYTADIENANGLHLIGDAQALATGESFIFPGALGRCERNDSGPIASSNDVLLAVAHRNVSPGQQLLWVWLFHVALDESDSDHLTSLSFGLPAGSGLGTAPSA